MLNYIFFFFFFMRIRAEFFSWLQTFSTYLMRFSTWITCMTITLEDVFLLAFHTSTFCSSFFVFIISHFPSDDFHTARTQLIKGNFLVIFNSFCVEYDFECTCVLPFLCLFFIVAFS